MRSLSRQNQGAFWVAFFWAAGFCHGQRAPEASHIYPPAGQAGTTVDLLLAATDLTPDSRFFFMDERLKLEVVGQPGPVLMPSAPYWKGIKSYLNDPNLTREVRARLTIPSGMPQGMVHWGVANASGAGDTGKFLITNSPVLLAPENHNGPQLELPLPANLCGRLGRIEEEDRYQIRATRDGIISCELVARRLGADFFGVLKVTDEAGGLVAEQADTAGLDPGVSFVAKKGKAYHIALHDVDHKGYRNFGYLLRLNEGPRVIASLPSGGKRGEKTVVKFLGIGLATGSAAVESVQREVVFPPGGDSFSYSLQTPYGTCLPHLLPLDDIADDVTLTPAALPVKIPGNWTGALDQGQATFIWTAKKGESLRLTAKALNPHSGQDLELEFQGPDGKKLADGDDSPGSSNPAPTFTAPADGNFRLILRDLNGVASKPADLFRLTARRVDPDFRLEIPATLALPAGGTGALTVKLVRLGGFKEAVTVDLDHLPTGVTAPEAAKRVIAATADSLKLDLVSAKNAPTDARLVRVVGQAKVDGKNTQRVALAIQPSGWDPWLLDTAPLDQVLVATTLKPPFKIKPLEADGGRRVNRGATHLAELSIERDKDFTGEIVLEMAARQQRHRQGIRGPSLTVGPGVKKIAYPVFLPEGLETSRTSRIGLVGMARVKDPSGAEKWVTGDVEGQITMSIEGALLKLTGPAEVELGRDLTAVLPVQLQRSAQLREPVVLELLVPAEIAGAMQAEKLVLSNGQQVPLDWKLKGTAALLRPGAYRVTARASTTRDGHAVVSEMEMTVVREEN